MSVLTIFPLRTWVHVQVLYNPLVCIVFLFWGRSGCSVKHQIGKSSGTCTMSSTDKHDHHS